MEKKKKSHVEIAKVYNKNPRNNEEKNKFMQILSSHLKSPKIIVKPHNNSIRLNKNLFKKKKKPAVVAHAFKPRHLGSRGRWIFEFKASLVYKVSSRVMQRNPVSRKKKKLLSC